MSDLSGPSAPTPVPRFPMTFGQVLDRVFRLMRGDFKLLVGVATVPMAAMMLLYVVMFGFFYSTGMFNHPPHPAQMQGPMAVAFSILMCVSIIPIMVLYSLYEAAGVHAGLDADNAQHATFGEARAVARRHAGRYVWLMVLRCLIVAAPIIGTAAVIGALAVLLAHGPARSFVLFCGLMLVYIGSVVYGIIIMLRLSLAFAASVAEGLPARAAIRRSFELTRGAKGHIFMVLFLIYLIGYAAMFILEIVAGLLIAVGALAFGHLGLHSAIAGPIGVTAAILAIAAVCFWMAALWAASQTAFAVIYGNQRLRLEGVTAEPVPAV